MDSISVSGDGRLYSLVPPMTRIYLSILVISACLFACSKKPKHEPIIQADTVVVHIDTVKRSHRPYAPFIPRVAPMYYGVNVDTLTAPQKAIVARLAGKLKKSPNATVTLTGFADTTGSAKYNLSLTHRRALNVLEALVVYGIDRNRMTAIGMGEIRGKLTQCRKTVITINP